MYECTYCGEYFIDKFALQTHRCNQTKLLRSPNSVISSSSSKKQSYKTYIAQLQSGYKKLEQYTEDLKDEYNNNIQILSKKCKTFQKQNEDLKNREHLTSTENQNLKLQLQQYVMIKITNDERDRQLEYITGQYTENEKELLKLKQTHELFCQNFERYRQDKESEITSLNDNFKKQLNTLEISKSKELDKTLHEEREKLLKQHREIQSVNIKLYEEEKNKLNNDIDNNTKEIKRLKQYSDNLIEKYKNNYKELEEKYNAEHDTLVKLKQEFSVWKEQHNNTVNSHQQTFNNLMNIKVSENQQLQNQIKELTTRLSDVNKQNIELEKTCSNHENTNSANINRFKKKINDLQSELNMANQLLAISKQEHEHQLNHKIQEYKEEINKLTGDINKHRQNDTNYETKYINLQKQYDVLHKNNIVLSQKNKESVSIIDGLEKTIILKTQEITAARNKIASVLIQNSTNKKVIIEFDKRQHQYIENINEAQKKYEILEKQYNSVCKQQEINQNQINKLNQQLQEELTRLQNDNTKINKKLELFHQKENEWVYQSKIIDELTISNNKLKREIEDNIKLQDKLNKQLTTYKENNTSLEIWKCEFHEKYKNIKNKYEDCSIKNEIIQNNINDIKKEYSSCIIERDNIIAKYEELSNRYQVSNKDLQELTDLKVKYENEILNYKQEIQKYHNEHSIIQEIKNKLEIKCTGLQHQLHFNENEVIRINKELDQLKIKYDNRIKSQQQQLNDKSLKIVDLETNLENLEKKQQEFENVTTELKNTKKLYENLNKEYVELSKKNRFEQNKIKIDNDNSEQNYQDDINKLHNNITRQSKTILKLENELQDLKHSKNDLTNQHSNDKKEIQNLKKINENLTSELIITKETIEKITKKEIPKICELCKNYESKLKLVEDQYNRQEESFKNEIECKDKSFKEIKNNLISIIDEHKSTINTNIKLNEELTRQKLKISEELSIIKHNLTLREQKISALQNELQQHKEKFENNEYTLKELNNDISLKKNILLEKEKEISILKNKNSIIEKESKKQTDKIINLEADIRKIQSNFTNSYKINENSKKSNENELNDLKQQLVIYQTQYENIKIEIEKYNDYDNIKKNYEASRIELKRNQEKSSNLETNYYNTVNLLAEARTEIKNQKNLIKNLENNLAVLYSDIKTYSEKLNNNNQYVDVIKAKNSNLELKLSELSSENSRIIQDCNSKLEKLLLEIQEITKKYNHTKIHEQSKVPRQEVEIHLIKISELEHNNQILNKKIQEYKTELSAIIEKDEIIKKLSTELNELKKQCENNKYDIQQKENAIIEYKNQVTKFNILIDEYKDKYNNLKTQSDILENKNRGISNIVIQLKDELKLQSEKYNKITEKYSDSTTKYDNLIREHTNCNDIKLQYNIINTTLQRRDILCKSLEVKINNLEKEKDDLISKHLLHIKTITENHEKELFNIEEPIKDKYNIQLNKLNDIIKVHKEQYEKAEKDNNKKLESIKQTSNEFERNCNKLYNSNIKLQKDIEDKTSEFNNLVDRYNNMENSLNSFRKEYKTIHSQFLNSEVSFRNYKKESNSILEKNNSEIEKLKLNIIELKKHNKKLENSLLNIKQKFHTNENHHRTEIDKLQLQIANHTIDIKKKEEELKIIKKESKKVEETNNKIDYLKTITELEKQLVTITNEMNNYKNELIVKDQQYSELYKRYIALENVNREHSAIIDHMREEMKKVKEINETHNNKIVKLEKENQVLQERPKILNNKMKSFRDESLREIHKYRHQIDSIKKENEKLELHINELNQAIFTSQNEIEQLRSELEHVIKMKDDLRNTYVNHLNDQKEVQETFVNDLKHTLSLRENRIAELENQLLQFVSKQLKI
jgi:chromosome segregation ATPase